jgi:hypothetical protein
MHVYLLKMRLKPTRGERHAARCLAATGALAIGRDFAINEKSLQHLHELKRINSKVKLHQLG